MYKKILVKTKIEQKEPGIGPLKKLTLISTFQPGCDLLRPFTSDKRSRKRIHREGLCLPQGSHRQEKTLNCLIRFVCIIAILKIEKIRISKLDELKTYCLLDCPENIHLP